MTTSGTKILRRHYIKGNPEREARIRHYSQASQVARDLYELRQKHKLTQQELAERVGTTPSVICQLEDAEYEGHSLRMLRRIAAALESEVQVVFVSRQRFPEADGDDTQLVSAAAGNRPGGVETEDL